MSEHTHESEHSSIRMRQIVGAIRNTWFSRNVTYILLVAAVSAAIATYFAITQSENPFGPDPKEVLSLILLDLVLVLALAAIITWKIISLWLARKRGSVGSRLQLRIILMFSLVSLVPTVIISVSSSIFFNYGIQSWFDERVDGALAASVAVAEGYLKEHKANIRSDTLAMANDLNLQSEELSRQPKKLARTVKAQGYLRNLSEAVIFQRRTLLAENPDFNLAFDLSDLPEDVLDQADAGQVVLLTNTQEDRVRALVKLANYFDAYLLVGRFVDPEVLNHLKRAKGSVSEYERLQSNISSLQIRFSVIFVGLALLLLLIALWTGLILTSDIIQPITRLIRATERVKAGKLSTRVPEGRKNDEIATLGRAFNRMTGQLEKQREELVSAHEQTELRRRMIEAVLEGVSAGVVALDSKRRVTLFNRSAEKLLHLPKNPRTHTNIKDVFKEVMPLVEQAAKEGRVSQKELTITRNKRKYTLLIRVVPEEFLDEIEGFIITFDDITDLMVAQRTAAWSDVARRIAHEIKNPLTPIQLAAERLEKKYSPRKKDDAAQFARYVATISNHVDSIGSIVDEFINFARMPSAKLTKQNIVGLARDSVFSEQEVHSNIRYNVDAKDDDIAIKGDKRQITQVLTNLLKNAAESIETKAKERKRYGPNIIVSVTQKGKQAILSIEDNGAGFPPDLINRITEPYVTTRDKGTGLGLAIVKKVMDDHEGKLEVANLTTAKGTVTGARVALTFNCA